jgi:hypothetical protein
LRFRNIDTEWFGRGLADDWDDLPFAVASSNYIFLPASRGLAGVLVLRRKANASAICFRLNWVYIDGRLGLADVGNCNLQVLFLAVARAFTRRRATPTLLTMITWIEEPLDHLGQMT